MISVIAPLILVSAMGKEPKCIRWTWTGDVYNRVVVCLEWSKPPPKPK
jgi:hypothetical protein